MANFVRSKKKAVEGEKGRREQHGKTFVNQFHVNRDEEKDRNREQQHFLCMLA